ncbi:MAG TPA: hypothetical protein DD379_11015 [Cyanobacteria bacterium UBA11162]|nr:hypothetical protein [Cyanobacteria bacterium UBA12227]HAX85670.1 hypothetical protein [Cyanobacteria bacterium UBA11370]HBL11918.1 hypothetical protein [Cyanobacteria bacterium UBA11162]HBY81502.1 hypothetical protein [Cyanobacteria bacterium UBA11148]
MRKQLEERLQALKAEFESGQKVLADLEIKQSSVRDTLLRISGAIQVLEEELAKANSKNGEVPQLSAPEIQAN